MKLALTIFMISLVVLLGCAPAPDPGDKATTPPKESSTPAPAGEVQQAVEGYVNGEWITSWDDALRYATALNRPVLVNFTGSDWCGWCIRLRNEVFSQQDFIDYASANLVLLTLDFPRSLPQSDELKAQNRSLQERFRIEGYPSIILVNSQGAEINRTGYQQGGAAAYVAHLRQLLARN